MYRWGAGVQVRGSRAQGLEGTQVARFPIDVPEVLPAGWPAAYTGFGLVRAQLPLALLFKFGLASICPCELGRFRRGARGVSCQVSWGRFRRIVAFRVVPLSGFMLARGFSV